MLHVRLIYFPFTYMQRKFINEERENATISGCMFKNFKSFVQKVYPTGITETDWDYVLVSANGACTHHELGRGGGSR